MSFFMLTPLCPPSPLVFLTHAVDYAHAHDWRGKVTVLQGMFIISLLQALKWNRCSCADCSILLAGHMVLVRTVNGKLVQVPVCDLERCGKKLPLYILASYALSAHRWEQFYCWSTKCDQVYAAIIYKRQSQILSKFVTRSLHDRY